MITATEYVIKLNPVFEGPLDLLMHLIRVNEIDIHDIPISFILEEYLKYLRELEKLDIDISSEFLVMVSTLLEIKSRMLLPSSFLDNMESDEEWLASIEDPRRELIRSLIFNEIHRRIEDILRENESVQLRIYPSGIHIQNVERPPDASFDLQKISLYDLLTEYQKLRLNEKISKIHIDMPVETMEDALQELIWHCSSGDMITTFTNALGQKIYPARVIIIFLAVLELVKLGMLEIEQTGQKKEIILRWK